MLTGRGEWRRTRILTRPAGNWIDRMADSVCRLASVQSTVRDVAGHGPTCGDLSGWRPLCPSGRRLRSEPGTTKPLHLFEADRAPACGVISNAPVTLVSALVAAPPHAFAKQVLIRC